ncbi:MAG: chaperone NapD [Rhodospirillaceae bacterium]|jgi:periplasmic nitrate reductase NapD|nr:chaperone NapD [Rhodospirillaceae bacterium]
MGQKQANDFNVCGVLVNARTENVAAVEAGLAELPGVEIHDHTDNGNIIVTVEDTDQSSASDSLLAIHQIAGVLSASLVYHQFEPAQ